MKPTAHRNLFNGDSNFLVGSTYAPPAGERYDIGIMERFVDQLADNGVDTYVINTNAQVPWYPSRKLQHILTGYRRGDRNFVRGHFPPTGPDFSPNQLEQCITDHLAFLDRLLDLVDAGVDWFEAVCRRCRERGLSPWGSIRMNDAHGGNSWEHSYMNCALQRDPRYRLSGRGVNPSAPPSRFRQLLDYRHREVRDYMFSLIREAVEDYHVEGVELDWLRQPFCCEPPASAEAIATMLAWMRDVRELCRNRSVFLGLRVPCRLNMLRDIGLDIAAMAREDLIDFVGFSNSWQTSWDVPYDELRDALGDDVAIYGVIEAAPNWLDTFSAQTNERSYRLQPNSPQFLRGNAAGKLALGVDGIEAFNFFCGDHARPMRREPRRGGCYRALRGLHDLHHLRGRSKQYSFASRVGLYTSFPEFELGEQVPVVLDPGTKQSLRLSMCSEPADAGLKLVIQVVVQQSESAPVIGVGFNGSWPTFAAAETDQLLFPCGVFTHHVPEHRAYNFAANVRDIREGWNEIVVYNESGKDAPPLRVVSVELAVIAPSED